MQSRHAVVWIDHREAKVFHFDRNHAEGLKIRSSKEFDQAHKHAGTVSGARTPVDKKFLHKIVEAITDAEEWLIVGPGNAKEEFAKHVRQHDHELAGRIIAVESADHPTDGQIVALARKFFMAADRMLG
jgi:stalled ribosome rescue protein Dom34